LDTALGDGDRVVEWDVVECHFLRRDHRRH
jgi:hypothetical protein